MSAFTHPFEFLVASTTRSPASVAISTVDVDMTYEELLDTSLRFAALLRAPGDFRIAPNTVRESDEGYAFYRWDFTSGQ
jgi:acyl-CoA synthetase (AMP-forming)/AMP-acid ligase II